MFHQKRIIISHLFGSDQKMARFLFEPMAGPSLRERPEILLHESWELQSEQQILIMAALDIWNGSGNAFLWQLLNSLGEENLARVIFALAECRRLKSRITTNTQIVSKNYE